MIVGTGPAGLECAHALANRGYHVVMAEKKAHAGGRVLLESRLPGLSEWKRVMDYRLDALKIMANVEIYYESEVTLENIDDFGFDNIIVATGASWKNNGQGQNNRKILTKDNSIIVLTPDDLMAGVIPQGKVVIYDTDHYYMAGVLAELCVSQGLHVSYMSPANRVSEWTENTLEQQKIQTRLMQNNVELILNHKLMIAKNNSIQSQCVYTNSMHVTECDTLILVTERCPNDQLFTTLEINNKFKSFSLIGDAYAPGIIAQAVHSGHLQAEIFGDTGANNGHFKRDKNPLLL
ncbi:MAG: FAD-dependent oxidoreductase [Alcanivoracaceae bacterium]|nr:FAD-dependent oxidoreductase [Alcanivoracaceae bacterium]